MHSLPTGTVTLLFTDIEGSTQLLEQVGERYASVLSECRDLLHLAFRTHHGHEVDMKGDAFFVTFARATDAVAAAVAAQRALASHAWPEGVTVRVRMGLHTGEPQWTAEGYVGLDVHHAARIMGVGHGGQVLLSQTTRDLVEHSLPEGVSLRDLGEHRLKDLQQKSRLYQLVIDGLPADFPPLLTLDIRPHNLPVQPTPFIGREREMALVQQLLEREDIRLLTLTGPGGSGKTRLSLQVAAELSDRFAGGVFFVNLAPLSDPDLVIPTIAQTLGLKDMGIRSMLEQLQTFLQEKELLLLLDNFEQVVDAAPGLADLLAACPRLKLLVTSRQVLRLSAEHEFAVPPLSLPDPRHLPDLVALSQYEAVALFIARAQAVKPDFQVTNANAPAVAEICARLDGLPLAIELAAARIKLLPPQALLARLGQRLAFLTGGLRDAPARQQTLRNTIDWSYRLLDVQEQRFFRRLSVFVGGCTLEAVEAVCNAARDLTIDVLERASSLIDKSLLRQAEPEEEPRFLMLETIREYGLEALKAAGEEEMTRQAHARYYLSLAEKAESELHGPEQAMWFDRLEQEHDNLRASLHWLLEGEAGHERIEMALRLGGALWWFWFVRGPRSEGWAELSRVLERSAGVAAPVRAKALLAAGWLASLLRHPRAEGLCQESLALYRELGDKAGMANASLRLGVVALRKSQLAVLRSRSEESLALFKELGDKEYIGWSLSNLATAALFQGDYTKAHLLAEQSLALFRELGDRGAVMVVLLYLAKTLIYEGDATKAQAVLEKGLAISKQIGHKGWEAQLKGMLGEVFLQQNNISLARPLIEESLALSREMGHQDGTILSLSLLARLEAGQGNYATARALYEESLALSREWEAYKWDTATSLEGLAAVVVQQGEPAWAARLWGAAEALREASGSPMPPAYRASYEQAVAAARTQLGERFFATAWAEGRSMTLDQALAARGPVTIPTSPSAGSHSTPTIRTSPTYPAGLTAREVEVLRLVAQGLSDAEIADRLVISYRTVTTHLSSIYNKLGVSSRSAATRFAVEHHLV